MEAWKAKGLLAVGFAVGLTSGAGDASAAGFSLLEQGGSGTGNAFAGSAAVAEDASTIFFNPAGMTLLPGAQVVAAGHGINIDTKFSGSGRTAPIPFTTLGSATGGNAGDLALVPNLYFAVPLSKRFAFGLGVNAPFGLKTEYDSNWLGRFQGIKSELTTINVNPSIAFQVNDTFSIGVGVNWQKADAELTNAAFLGPLGEGLTRLNADDAGWGWNVGAMFRLGSDMRIGVAYRSSIDYTLDGDVTTTHNATGAVFAPGTFPAQADITFPDIASLSVMQSFGDRWELLGDIMYTHWRQVDGVTVIDKSTGRVADRLTFAFDDAWRVALGLNYHSSERWTFKGGVAYDQSPVKDETRTVRLPDSDRVWLAIGAKYRFSKQASVDVGYVHLFIYDADINFTRTVTPPLTTTVTGSYDSAIDILSLQLTWTF